MAQIKRMAIFTAAVFLVIAAALVNAAQLYFMAAILLVLPIVSYLVGLLALRDLEFEREIPASGWAGERATFKLCVRSKSRLPRHSIQARDILPEWIVEDEEEPPCVNVAPNTITRVDYKVHLLKRGFYAIDSMVVTFQDPLGLFVYNKLFKVHSEIVVYPVPEDVKDIILSGAERYGSRELPIAATRGSGLDPDGVRQYIPGDPLRRMHWKSTARTGKLNVIEFEEAKAVNVVIVLDLYQGTNIGTGKDTTLEYLVRMAASLAQNAIRQGASVRLITGDEADPADFAGRGSEHLFAILSSLARAESTDPNPLSSRLLERVGVLHPGTSVVVLTSDADLQLPGAISHITSSGVPTMVFYADPRSFLAGHSRPSERVMNEFMEGLLSAQAIPVVLKKQAEGRLIAEQMDYVGSVT
jgi:uncharacterized protein (DUF58 family)